MNRGGLLHRGGQRDVLAAHDLCAGVLGALRVRYGCGSKPFWDPFWGFFGAPPVLEPILVGIGMFTGGTGF